MGFKNCRVLVKDKVNENLLADTFIIRFDAGAGYLTVPANSLSNSRGENVSVLIFNEQGIYEYQGVVKTAVVANEVDILLSAGRLKNDRDCTRYRIAAHGKVPQISLRNKSVDLRKAIDVATKDISAKGVLFEAQTGSFEVGNRIRLKLELDGVSLQSIYQILRIQNGTLWTEEYGCRMVSPKAGEKKYAGKPKEKRTEDGTA